MNTPVADKDAVNVEYLKTIYPASDEFEDAVNDLIAASAGGAPSFNYLSTVVPGDVIVANSTSFTLLNLLPPLGGIYNGLTPVSDSVALEADKVYKIDLSLYYLVSDTTARPVISFTNGLTAEEPNIVSTP